MHRKYPRVQGLWHRTETCCEQEIRLQGNFHISCHLSPYPCSSSTILLLWNAPFFMCYKTTVFTLEDFLLGHLGNLLLCSFLLWHSSQWTRVVLTWGYYSSEGNFYSSSSLLDPGSKGACMLHSCFLSECSLAVILTKPKWPLFFCDYF